MVYTLSFFSSKFSLFHNSNVFGTCIIHILYKLYTGCAKIKKKIISASKVEVFGGVKNTLFYVMPVMYQNVVVPFWKLSGLVCRIGSSVFTLFGVEFPERGNSGAAPRAISRILACPRESVLCLRFG